MRTPLEKRLLAAFGLILFLLMAACGLSILSAHTISEKAETIIRHPFPVTNAILGVDAATTKIRLAIKELVEAETAEEARARVEEIARLDQAMDGYISVVRTRYLGPKQDVDELEEAVAKWRPVRAEIVRHVLEGRRRQAADMARSVGARHYLEVDRAAQVILTFARGKAAELISQSRQAASTAIFYSVALTAAFILTGGTVSFIVLRSLSRSHQDLAKARGFIRNILNSMPSVVIGVDESGRITHLNHKAESSLPEPAMAVGHPLERHFPQYSEDMEAVRRAIRERGPILLEKQPVLVDGESRYQDVLIYPLVTNGVEGAVLRIDDVTERVRLTEMMVQTEKMLSVGGLAAGMAHEINNPLGAILQSAQVIQNHVDPASPVNARVAEECGCSIEKVAAYLEKRQVPSFLAGIRESGARAARIVANMLDFSRSGDDQKAPVHLADILEKSLELASTDYDLKKKFDFRHITIRKDFDPDLPPALCSRTEIEQVVLNILKNAAHALADKRFDQDKPTISLRTRSSGRTVSVIIEDNGPGMDEAVRKRVFEPFFTTKKPGHGTGLGLSVSYFLVTANNGGSITVDSEPGKGARFVVSLPAGA